MVMREAFAFATPVAVSAIGPLPSLVDSGRAGVIFEPGSADALLAAVRAAWTDPVRLQALGERSHDSFERLYTEDTNHEQLMVIYNTALACHHAGAHGD